VAKSDVLVRVKNDLAQGHTHLAIQRLRTLAAVKPDDLEVHRMLAGVYRQAGNPVEAGRWAFLTDDLRPDELAAFERANPDPWLRLRLVDWPADLSALPDEGAQQRLTALRESAERSGPPDKWPGPDQSPRAHGSAIPCLFVVLTLVVLGTLATIGLIRVVMLLLP
jgi:hypothetical protein